MKKFYLFKLKSKINMIKNNKLKILNISFSNVFFNYFNYI